LAIFVAATCLVVALTSFALYRAHFGSFLSVHAKDWGVFGEFAGGLLGPIAALASVFLLVIVIYQQDQLLRANRLEMRLTRDVFEHEAFQSRFFSLLDLFVKCRAAQRMYNQEGHQAIAAVFNHAIGRMGAKSINHASDGEVNATLDEVRETMESGGASAAAYFRTFFAVLEYLELSKRQSKKNEPFGYVFRDIAFSTLSDPELICVFLFVAAVRAGKPPTGLEINNDIANECYLRTQRALRPEFSIPIGQMWTNVTSRPR
jgi:uncharacterized membrane protein